MPQLFSRLRPVFLFLILVVAGGCAKVYHKIEPASIPLARSEINQYGLEMSHYYDLLALRGNKRLAKKERRKDIKLLVVSITNHNDFSINVRRELEFVVDGNPIVLLPQQELYQSLKQRGLFYLLYAFVILPVDISSSNRVIIPIGLPFAAYNVAVALRANNRLLEELTIYDIQNRILAAGETITGIIGIQSEGVPYLDVRLKQFTD